MLESLCKKLTNIIELKKNSAHTPIEELRKIDRDYEQSIDTIHSVKKELEELCLHEKIINRRTLKIIQILCQVTVNNGLDDSTITWAANFVIEHIKNQDLENMDIWLSCIVDIILFDRDLSVPFLKIYKSLIYLFEGKPNLIVESNPRSAQLITIIKAIFDMFCIIENCGVDVFEEHLQEGNNPDANVNESEASIKYQLKLWNYLIGYIIEKFLFWWNIYVRALWSEGIIKILLEKKLGTIPNNLIANQNRVTGNESLYW